MKTTGVREDTIELLDKLKDATGYSKVIIVRMAVEDFAKKHLPEQAGQEVGGNGKVEICV